MATLNEIATALNKAADAGDHEAAKELASAYTQLKSSSEWENNAPVEGMKSDYEYALEQTRKHGPLAKIKEISRGGAEGMIPFANLIEPKNVDTNSGLYQASKIAGNIALGTGVAGALGKVAEMGNLPNLARTLASSGSEGKSILQQMLGGGVTSGATSLLTNPEDTVTNAGIGAVLPVGMKGLGKIGSSLYDLTSGEMAKVNAGKIGREALGSNEQAIRNALANAPESLTATQATYNIPNNEVWSALGAIGKEANAIPYYRKEIAQSKNLNRQFEDILPAERASAIAERQGVANRTNELNALNEAKNQGINAKLNELNVLNEANNQNLASGIRQFESGTTKDVSQMNLGQGIIGRKEALEEASRKNINKEYQKAWELAPKPVEITDLTKHASGISGDISSLLNPKSDAKLAASIQRVFQPTEAQSSKLLYSAGVPVGTTEAKEAVPATATLKDLHEINKAINEPLYSAKIATDPASRQLYTKLQDLKTGVQNAINNNENIPKEAVDAYKNAQTQWLKQVQEPFSEGQITKLTRENSVNRPITMPEDVVDSFLSKESHAVDFNRAFGNDPKSIQALGVGVEQKLMNASNPEKFLSDNKFALNELYKTNPELEPRLNNLSNQLRLFDVKKKELESGFNLGTKNIETEKKALEAERNLIPKQVEIERQNSVINPANTGRVVREFMNTAWPNAKSSKIKADSYLSSIGKNEQNVIQKATGAEGKNISDYFTKEGAKPFSNLENYLLREQKLSNEASAGNEIARDIIKKHVLRERLPSFLNPVFTIGNKALGVIEGKVAGATGKQLSEMMASPQKALEMLDTLPADQRDTVIRLLRQSGPTLTRAAIASNQQ